MKILFMKNRRRNKNKNYMYPQQMGFVNHNSPTSKISISTDTGNYCTEPRNAPAKLVGFERNRQAAARYAEDFLEGIDHAIDVTVPEGYAIWVLS